MDVGDITYTTDISGAGRFGDVHRVDARPRTSPASSRRSGSRPSPKRTRRRARRTPRPWSSAPPTARGSRSARSPSASRSAATARRSGVGAQGQARDRARRGRRLPAPAPGRQRRGAVRDRPGRRHADGVRFEGGTGLKVNLPVSASLFGVFTVQFLELELLFEPDDDARPARRLLAQARPVRGVGRPGRRVASTSRRSAAASTRSATSSASRRRRASGSSLDAGVVKGGGYLFIDEPARRVRRRARAEVPDLVDQGDRPALDEAPRRQRGLVAAAVRVRPVLDPHRVRDLLDRRSAG